MVVQTYPCPYCGEDGHQLYECPQAEQDDNDVMEFLEQQEARITDLEVRRATR